MDLPISHCLPYTQCLLQKWFKDGGTRCPSPNLIRSHDSYVSAKLNYCSSDFLFAFIFCLWFQFATHIRGSRLYHLKSTTLTTRKLIHCSASFIMSGNCM